MMMMMMMMMCVERSLLTGAQLRDQQISCHGRATHPPAGTDRSTPRDGWRPMAQAQAQGRRRLPRRPRWRR
jgi:hypothetical protein